MVEGRHRQQSPAHIGAVGCYFNKESEMDGVGGSRSSWLTVFQRDLCDDSRDASLPGWLSSSYRSTTDNQRDVGKHFGDTLTDSTLFWRLARTFTGKYAILDLISVNIHTVISLVNAHACTCILRTCILFLCVELIVAALCKGCQFVYRIVTLTRL